MWPCLRKRHQPLSPALVSFSVLCRGNGSAASHSPPVNFYSPWGFFFFARSVLLLDSNPHSWQVRLLPLITNNMQKTNQPLRDHLEAFTPAVLLVQLLWRTGFIQRLLSFKHFKLPTVCYLSLCSLIMKIVIEAEISSPKDD